MPRSSEAGGRPAVGLWQSDSPGWRIGAVISVDDPESSLLLQKVLAADDEGRMPPQGEGERLSTEQVELLKRWIQKGAAFPENEPVPADPATWWSYQPVIKPTVPTPAISDPNWIRNPIDGFIAMKHAEHNVHHSQEARPEVLLRRVYLDLLVFRPHLLSSPHTSMIRHRSL